MAQSCSFKFLDDQLNQEFIGLLRRERIKHSIDKNGVVHYSSVDEEIVENDLISSIRDRIFPSWAVLTCPAEWKGRYRDHMRRRRIPFREELSNGQLWFLLPRKYRPHSWKLELALEKKVPTAARGR